MRSQFNIQTTGTARALRSYEGGAVSVYPDLAGGATVRFSTIPGEQSRGDRVEHHLDADEVRALIEHLSGVLRFELPRA